MKKRHYFAFIMIVAFIVSRMIRASVNLDEATWDGISRVFSVIIVISFISSFKQAGKPGTTDSDKSNTLVQIKDEIQSEPSQKINQALYDEDSFKIDPEDYKL
ncbi:MAG: hypothetical protein PHO96_00945 [Candidatus Izemoplasmatales bacterium]|nr:hypothetical protein [Candidatus Izemoplasmatales bacterium]